MLTDLDRLLLRVTEETSREERLQIGDLLIDQGREAEAQRIVEPGRILVRLTEGHCWIYLQWRPLRTYGGVLGGDELGQPAAIVWVQTGDDRTCRELLDPAASLRVRSHSPTGYAWGYQGSGPAQLALAILLDCCGRRLAERHYQDFRRLRASRWAQDGWSIQEEVIWRLVDILEMGTGLSADELATLRRQL